MIISFQGAQYIGMASGTDTFVDKNSQLYQNFDHLYQNLFGTESIIIMVEGSDVTNPELLKAMDRAYKSTVNIPGVIQVNSPSSIIKNANYEMTGRSEIPDDGEVIDEIISSSVPTYYLPDETHAIMSVVVEATTSDATKEEILRETRTSIEMADFPGDYNVIVTGDPAFMVEMNEAMNSSMGTVTHDLNSPHDSCAISCLQTCKMETSPASNCHTRYHFHFWSHGLPGYPHDNGFHVRFPGTYWTWYRLRNSVP